MSQNCFEFLETLLLSKSAGDGGSISLRTQVTSLEPFDNKTFNHLPKPSTTFQKLQPPSKTFDHLSKNSTTCTKTSKRLPKLSTSFRNFQPSTQTFNCFPTLEPSRLRPKKDLAHFAMGHKSTLQWVLCWEF